MEFGVVRAGSRFLVVVSGLRFSLAFLGRGRVFYRLGGRGGFVSIGVSY